MQVNTYADVDIVAVEQDDEVTVMIELVAPTPVSDAPRPSAAVQVVLDRSGSMGGERLEAAKQALVRLVDRLDSGDRFGVVAFDDEVRVVVPAGDLQDKHAARLNIADVHTGGMTNLSGGLLRGLQEARRVAGDGGSTLLLLSDGHANAGEIDPAKLASVAASARDHGITTSTVGIGMGYDEVLLSDLARGGQGNHVFAEHGDGAAAAVAGEIEGLLSKTVQAASLIIRPAAAVDTVTVWNDLPGQPVDGGIMVELGDLWAGEERKLVLTFAVPAKPGARPRPDRRARAALRRAAGLRRGDGHDPGPRQRGARRPGGRPDPRREGPHRARLPADAGRQAQGGRRAAHGDHDTARRAYDAVAGKLDALMAACPSAEIAQERDVIAQLRDRAEHGEAAWAAKYSAMDQARKSRKRGRRDLDM